MSDKSHKIGGDRPDMTIAVYWGVKQQENKNKPFAILAVLEGTFQFSRTKTCLNWVCTLKHAMSGYLGVKRLIKRYTFPLRFKTLNQIYQVEHLLK